MPMDGYLIKVKNVAKKMEEVKVGLTEDIMVYYIIKNLQKEYDVFCEVQQDKQQLPTYEKLESKLLQELILNSKAIEDQGGEALAVGGRINFYDQGQRYPSWPNSNQSFGGSHYGHQGGPTNTFGQSSNYGRLSHQPPNYNGGTP